LRVSVKKEPTKEAEYLQEGSNSKSAARQTKSEQNKEKIDVV